MKKTLLTIMAGALVIMSKAQNPFPTLNVDFYDSTSYKDGLTEVVIPASPVKYDVLFVGGVDSVWSDANNAYGTAKEWQDFTGYVPIDNRSDSGYIVVNHERLNRDAINGDGGGMTVMTVHKDATGKWSVVPAANGSKFRSVDFSSVGGTAANCGGIQTSWGQVFTAEEWGVFNSNAAINDPLANGLGFAVDPGNAGGISDTSDFTIVDFNGTTINRDVRKYQNYQYMVEVDVENAVAVRKNYNMGRFDHEGGWIASDRKTVYLSDDNSSGSVLFRFVADVAEDFSQGQLSAYKQSDDANTGSWINLPMDLDSMMDVRNVALNKGATIFMRLEWVEGIDDNTIFITETGRGGPRDVSARVALGGKLAKHLKDLDIADGTDDNAFTDLYGRVLRLNVATGKLEVALEGGGDTTATGVPVGNHLTSPDGLCSATINGRTYLAINEDMNISAGVQPANPATFGGSKLNEIYILDVTGDAPGTTYTVADLKRFMAGPNGCETTGGRFTPDGLTYFVNIQHPSTSNTPPFDHSVTIAVTGYYTAPVVDGINDNLSNNGLVAFPNPVSRELNLNKVTDIAIYDMNGKRIITKRNTNVIDVTTLTPGSYLLQSIDGEVNKIIVE